MRADWVEIEVDGERRRVRLGAQPRRLAAAGGDLEITGTPARIRYRGPGPEPRVGQEPLPAGEAPLDVWISCGELRLRLGCDFPEARLESVPASRAASRPDLDGLIWRRLKAGLAVELGLADREVALRWQRAVVEASFEPEACAADVLAAGLSPQAQEALLERSARLQRDLLMAPALRGARGATRRVREGARGLVAFTVAQLVVLSVLVAITVAGMLVLRLVWKLSFDGFFDSIGELFRS